MKKLMIFCTLCIILFACEKDPTRVTVMDNNQDRVAHLAPDPNILGNTEIFFIPATIQGSAIWIVNGPGAHVGVDIRDINNANFIYFADSYISKGGNKAQTGTQIPWDKWMRTRLVVYKSGLAGWVINFIDSLGLNFFDSIENFMVERIYETDVYLSPDGQRFSTPVREYSSLKMIKNESLSK